MAASTFVFIFQVSLVDAILNTYVTPTPAERVTQNHNEDRTLWFKIFLLVTENELILLFVCTKIDQIL